MALFVEKENPPAGTSYKVGDNAELDAAISAGEAAGITVGADGYYIKEDGGRIESAGGTTKVVDLSGATPEELSAIDELAELQFLAMQGGVSSRLMKQAYENLGIDSSDNFAFTEAEKLLEAAGYNNGNPKTFFENKGGYKGDDAAIQILLERYKDEPTEQDLIDAGLDPSEVSLVNSSTATNAYVAQEMANRGLSFDQTKQGNVLKSRMAEQPGGATGTYQYYKDYTEDSLQEGSYWDKKRKAAGKSLDDIQIDMMEWDLLKKKKQEVDQTPYTVDQPTATITGGNVSGSTPGTSFTGGSTGITAPNFVSTPNIGAVTPVYPEGMTGTSETSIPTYEAGLTKQKTAFDTRATNQAAMYQPQTLQEQQEAGTAPSFENKMYRNRLGMTMYIQHINGKPSQPIPAGYTLVQDFTTQDQAGTAAAQQMNAGGVVSGYAEGGITTAQRSTGEADYTVFVYNGKDYRSMAEAQAAQAADNTASTGTTTDNTGTTSSTTNATVTPATFTDGRRASGEEVDGVQAYLVGSGANTRMIYTVNGQDYDSGYEASQAAASGGTAGAAAETQPDPTASINQNVPTGQQDVTAEGLAQAQRNLVAQAYTAPGGSVAAAPVAYIDPNAYGTTIESTAGQALGTAPMVTGDQVAQIDTATTADLPQKIGAAQVDATPNAVFSDVSNLTAGTQAAQGTLGTQAQVDAAQQTGTSLAGLQSATGTSTDVVAPDARTMQAGETISGSAVDQTQVGQAFGTGEVQAASVQGELAGLMQQFEGGETPAWAAGSMRAAMATLSARGLGASSLAGQAVIQAAMESALPIAQIDASNKQQVALFKAEQRAKFLQMDFDQAFQAKVMNAAKVSEIANMNFSAEQQIALENSRAANTMNLQNLNNRQAMVMAEAAALAQMDAANLNNRQQAAVQNAQNFLQMDMANLSNQQQTALFKTQQNISALLTDQAAANAAQQFNASSENQTNQFFANLSASVGQFNAAQMNAMKQFNADEVNSLLEFNATIQNQREMFNAQNYLVVAQANAQWRQNLNTANTAAANDSNMEYATTVNALTLKSLDEIWQRERDLMDYAYNSSENASDRALNLLLADKDLDAVRMELESQESSAKGSLWTKVLFGGGSGGGLLGGLFD